jgi:hypothetical protein
MNKRNLGLCLTSLILLMVSCTEDGASYTLPILAFPGPAPNFSASDCLIEQRLLPYVCGVVPGQTVASQVQNLVGEPGETYRGDYCRVDELFGEKAETCWTYPYPHSISIFFENEVVVGVNTALEAYELTLGEAVEALGPPEAVQLSYGEGASPAGWEEGRANLVTFLWPGKGIYMGTHLYGTQGVAQDERLAPLPAELPVDMMVAFEPCTLEELKSLLGGMLYDRWVEWPGMTE